MPETPEPKAATAPEVPAPAKTAPAPKPKAKRVPSKPADPKSSPTDSTGPAKIAPKAPAAKPATRPPPTPKAATPPAAPPGTVVDVSGLVLGRAASVIAQRLLKGESIVVVNAEKSVVTGSRENVLSFYTANRARGSKRTGPHYPRYPDRIFRRTVRGMLPHLKTRGKEALDRLDVFIGVPVPVAAVPKQSIDIAKARPSLRTPLTLEEISRLLGARL